MYYLCRENKGAIQLCGTASLICVFDFAYAVSWFSHDMAHVAQEPVFLNRWIEWMEGFALLSEWEKGFLGKWTT